MAQDTLAQRMIKLERMKNEVLDKFYTDNPENDVLSKERKLELENLENEIDKFEHTPLTIAN